MLWEAGWGGGVAGAGAGNETAPVFGPVGGPAGVGAWLRGVSYTTQVPRDTRFVFCFVWS